MRSQKLRIFWGEIAFDSDMKKAQYRLSFFRNLGAGNESRTRDLNLGKVALYQLSYSRDRLSILMNLFRNASLFVTFLNFFLFDNPAALLNRRNQVL